MNGLDGISLVLNMHPCGSFYEKYSGQSFIEMNMPFDKDSEQLFEFEYEYTDCSSF